MKGDIGLPEDCTQCWEYTHQACMPCSICTTEEYVPCVHCPSNIRRVVLSEA
ncbi:MAG: hypothetical protein ACE5PO_06400 [Candidatus Bathyarchaeia archaeon]